MTDTRSTETPGADTAAASDLHGKINDAVSTARENAQKAITTSLDATQKALETTRDATRKAFESASARTSEAARATGEAIEANLVAALAGGVLLGAAAAAFLPRTERELELIGPVGKRLADSARSAAQAAFDTGKSELASIGLSQDAIQTQAKSLLEGVLGALGEAGKAAGKAAGAKKD